MTTVLTTDDQNHLSKIGREIDKMIDKALPINKSIKQ